MFIFNRSELEARIVQLCAMVSDRPSAIAPRLALDICEELNKDRSWWNRVSLGDTYLLLNRLEILEYLVSDERDCVVEEVCLSQKFYQSTGKRFPVKQKKLLGKLRLGVEALTIEKTARI